VEQSYNQAFYFSAKKEDLAFGNGLMVEDLGVSGEIQSISIQISLTLTRSKLAPCMRVLPALLGRMLSCLCSRSFGSFSHVRCSLKPTRKCIIPNLY